MRSDGLLLCVHLAQKTVNNGAGTILYKRFVVTLGISAEFMGETINITKTQKLY
jgi:hypothetical protein